MQVNLCPVCLDKSQQWAQGEKTRYSTAVKLSLLCMLLAIFPLSFFGWIHGMEIILSFLVVILGVLTGPIYFRAAIKTFTWILDEPYYAYVRLFPRQPDFSFLFRSSVYHSAFSEENPDSTSFQRSDFRPSIGFPMGLVWLALGFLFLVFLALGIESTLNIAIRWILAVLFVLLPMYIIGETKFPEEQQPETVEPEQGEDDADWL